MISGTLVKIGGQDYVVPPYNFGRIKRIAPHLQQLSAYLQQPSATSIMNDAYLDAVLQLLLIALERNYPDITADFLQENLDWAEVPAFMEVIVNQFVEKKVENLTPILPGMTFTQS